MAGKLGRDMEAEVWEEDGIQCLVSLPGQAQGLK